MGLRDAGRQMLVQADDVQQWRRRQVEPQQATVSDFTAIVVTDNDAGRNNDCGLSWSDWRVNR